MVQLLVRQSQKFKTMEVDRKRPHLVTRNGGVFIVLSLLNQLNWSEADYNVA